MRRFLLALCVVAVMMFLTTFAAATSITFTNSSGNLAASAVFTLSGNTLTVVLTNTSTHDVLVPTDVLEGVYFNTTSALTPVSAALFGGSTVHYGTLTNVGKGWGFAQGVSAQGKNSGISAMGAVNGLGHANFDSADCPTQSSCPLQGVDYGLLSAGDNLATGNTGVTGHGPLIQDAVEFTLTASTGFDLSQLGSSVVFQYGTALNEPSFKGQQPPKTPEPASLLLLVSGIGGLALLRRRK